MSEIDVKIQEISENGQYLSSKEWNGKSPVGKYVTIGDPAQTPAYFYNGGWVCGVAPVVPSTEEPTDTVTKIRFMELLGGAFEKFYVALSQEQDPEKLGKLRLAEAYFNNASQIELGSDLVKNFTHQFVLMGFMSELDEQRVLANKLG